MYNQGRTERHHIWLALVAISALLLAACGATPSNARPSSGVPTQSTQAVESLQGTAASSGSLRVDGTSINGLAGSFVASSVYTSALGGAVFAVGEARCGTTKCPAIATSSLNSRLEPVGWKTITLPHLGYVKAAGVTIVSDFGFATAKEGYALFTRYAKASIDAQLYVTEDGGLTWHSVVFHHQQALAAAFTTHSLVALSGSCADHSGAQACGQYSLQRIALPSRKTATFRLSIPQLPTPFLETPALAAQGSMIAVVADATGPRTAKPLLLVSRSPTESFVQLTRPSLGSVDVCHLMIREPAIWASCPTGMMVSVLRTASPSGHFTQVWDHAGTLPDAFAPVSAQDAYRLVINQQETREMLQLSTDGGQHFHSVAVIGPPEFSMGGVSLSFVSLRTGFLTVDRFADRQLSPILWGTANGGVTWHEIFPPT